ncbi:MAG: hypothetical protein GC137_03940 [Alphaproteobacteria bacterium]|nr:hypothetical protein [Alphaproteobacteria bacterium]
MNRTQKLGTSIALALSLAACGSDEKPTPNNPPSCCTTDAFNDVVIHAKPERVQSDYPLRFFADGSKTVSLLGLIDQTGETIDEAYLTEHLKGKRLMLYFGFPTCEVFCPPSTNAMMQLADRHPELVPLVIANQPGYSVEDMAVWAGKIDPESRHGVIALTGSEHKLAVIFQTLNVNVQNGSIHLPTVEFIDETGQWSSSAIALKKGVVQRFDPDLASLQIKYQEAFGVHNTLQPLVPR